MSEVSVIIDAGDEFYGPYTNPQLAQRTLDIIKKVQGDYSELYTFSANPHEEHIMQGLMPFKVSVELSRGVPQKPEIHMIWPPLSYEGIISESDFLIEYFFWALNRGDALRKLGSVKRETCRKPLEAEAF